MSTPKSVQTRINRQYLTAIQQCFSIVSPVVNREPDPNDHPRPHQLTGDALARLAKTLTLVGMATLDATKYLDAAHITPIHMRVAACRTLAVDLDPERAHGYSIAVLIQAVLEGLPADLFETDEEASDPQ